jgi:hypothetical protein
MFINAPEAVIEIWNGGTHRVPVDHRLIQAMRFGHMPLHVWDRITPQERKAYLEACEWWNQQVERLKLEHAGV